MVGKSGEFAKPVIAGIAGGICSDAESRIETVPPKYVDHTNAEPDAFSFETNAVCPELVERFTLWKALAVVGKEPSNVLPVRYAFPAESIAMSFPWVTKKEPPRYVEYTSAVPVELNLVTKALKPAVGLV